ncbi:MAG: hypothetical protein J0M03_23180 [Acidobacteria bacterium]|nr:hypothetical protein [Acidobacteriota bacterium]
MTTRKLFVSLLLMLIAILSTTTITLADEKIDFNKTRIARVSFVEGEVGIQRQGSDKWDDSEINVPVFPGDLIYSTDDGRTELELYGGFIRLSKNTSLELVEFSPKLYRFDMSVGLATFSFGENRPAIEIATPQAAISLKQAGIYRVSVSPDGSTVVIVHEGQAEIAGKTKTFKLNKGKRAIFPPTSLSNVAISNVYGLDAWDNWNSERELLVSVNSINGFLKPQPFLYGNSLLNQHGLWVQVPTYGFVWRPNNLAANWAPYRIGRWAHYNRVGWTWISQEAWGWAPYHYGYWVFVAKYGWVWVPDGINNFWSPALVSWYYGSWDGRDYICWHPNNWWNNWPTTGGGNGWVPPQEPGGPGKPTRPHPVLKNEPLVAGGSAIPVDGFTGGQTNPKNHPLTDGIKVVKQIETINLPKPTTSTSTSNIPISKLPSDILITRPLVSKFGVVTDGVITSGSRRSYQTPTTSNNSEPIVRNSNDTITTTAAPATPVKNPRVRNTDDTPIVRTDSPSRNSDSGGSKGNNGNNGNSGNSGNSNRPSASESFGRTSQPTVSSPSPSPSVSRDSSPSISRDSSPSRGGGGGRNRND